MSHLRRLPPALLLACLALAVALPLAGQGQRPKGKKDAPVKSFTNSVGMKLVLIPKGKFMMGSPAGEKGRYDNEGPRHEVKITRAFYMAAHTVTVGQFKQFVEGEEYRTDAERDGKGGYGYNADTKTGDGPKPKYTWRNPGWKQTDWHPVVNVSWNDAAAYCKWLSKKEGKPYRLPTEAEWEYACRAGTTTRYYFGDENAGLKDHANMGDQALKKNLDAETYKKAGFAAWDDGHAFTAPVGSYKANPWGLFDMHGNVSQWCKDCYDERFFRHSGKEDPECAKGADRVVRNGAWDDVWRHCRSAYRNWSAPANRNDNIGFRVACSRLARTP
jgi:formylglycine-generating enzyme required for sulfatase activity